MNNIFKKSYKTGLIGVAVLLVFVFLFIQSDVLFFKLKDLLDQSADLIMQYPRAGMFLFVLLSALAAMLAFFSTAVIVPIGVTTWGLELCFFLLALGWCIGGVLAYVLGFTAGDKLVKCIVGKERLSMLKQKISEHASFLNILLFHMVLPSEIPGYVLGTLKINFKYYLTALIITELPYALVTVYLGESLLQRNLPLFIVIFSGLLLMLFIIYKIYHRQLDEK